MAYKAKKKSNFWTKVFVWFMFGAMLASFAASVLYYILVS